MDVFTEHLAEALAAAQAEVIAAKVPISGYGRVEDNFDHLKPLIVQLNLTLNAHHRQPSAETAAARQRARRGA